MPEELVTMQIEDDQQQQTADPLYADEELNIFVDDEPQMDDAQKKLMDELKQKQAELEAAKQQNDPVAAMSKGIEALGQRLAPQQAPDVRLPGPGQLDVKKLREDVNAKFYDDPFATITELMQIVQQGNGTQQANTNLMYSKRLLQVDPSTRDLYKRFENEVEVEVSRMSIQERMNNPAVYDEALTRVKARHMEELMDERVKAEIAKLQQPANGQQQQQKQTRPATYAEQGGARPSIGSGPSIGAGGERTIKITSAKKAEIEAYAEAHFIPVNAAARLFENRGWLK